MTTRRNFLRGAALVAAGLMAADQLELVERLTHTRRLFPAWPGMPTLYGDGVHDDSPAVQAFMNGRRVWDARTGRLHPADMLSGGTHYLANTVTVGPGGPHGHVVHNVFISPRNSTAFDFPPPISPVFDFQYPVVVSNSEG